MRFPVRWSLQRQVLDGHAIAYQHLPLIRTAMKRSRVMYGLGRLSSPFKWIQSIATGHRPRNFSGIAPLFLVISRVHVFFFPFAFLEIDAPVKRTDATSESFPLCRFSPRLYRFTAWLMWTFVHVYVWRHASRGWQFIDNAWLRSTKFSPRVL